MARRFRRTKDGVEARLEAVEAGLLGSLVRDLLDLLGEDPASGDEVLARLFPPGYRDDPAAAEDLRSLIQDDLREGKRTALREVLTGLGARDGKGRLVLDGPAAEQWLGALNDLRLSLGTRLDVTEETYDELTARAGAEDDAREHALEVYVWLGWLQESLVDALTA